MATSYTSLLGLALPVTGELSGTWGDTVNDYITQYIDASVAGTQTISGSLTAVTLSKTTNAALSQAGSGATGSSQYQIINCTGNPASELTVTVPAASKAYLVLNNTSTNQSVKVVGAGPTTGVTVAAARCALIAWNGSDFELVASTDVAALQGLGTGVATALGVNVGTAGAFVVNGGALGTPSSGTVTNLTGTASININGTVGATTPTTGAFTTLTTSSTVTLNGGTANGVAYLNGSKVLTTGSALTFDGTNFATTGSVTSAGASNSGNLAFTGTGNRITGDFSNATIANRVAFQTSTVNGDTNLGLIPNGTSTTSRLAIHNNSDVANSSLLNLVCNSSAAVINSAQVGTGTFLPMTFYTGGSERVRIDTSGNVGIGTSSPLAKLDVVGASAVTSFTGTTRLGVTVRGSTSTNDYSGIDFTGASSAGPTARIAVISGAFGSSLQFGTSSSYGSGITNTAMTLDSSGNVGIGTSSPAYRLDVNSGATATYSRFKNDNGSVSFETVSGGANSITSLNSAGNASQAFAFNGSGGTEWMRITSGGEVYIAGTTDQGAYNLQVNGTGVWGAGAYVNGSDARLKENVQTLTDGLSVVTQLRPVTFQYKADYSKDTAVQPGFIAQELQQAMAGKDYVDGVVQAGPEYLNVAYQSLIPVLTKAIQELKAELDLVKAELQTLKGN